MRIAVMDDWQGVARTSADWSALETRADLTILDQAFASEDAAAATLAPFDILIPMRERTRFTATLLARLPNLRLIAQTGGRAMTLDLAACTAAGIQVCTTAGQKSGISTAELALGLMLATTRHIPQGDQALRAGRFQQGVGVGPVLDGRTLGIIGFGRIGARMGGYGRALGMKLLAWSPNLTAEKAAAGGADPVDRDTLLATSDVISLHMVLSDRTRSMLAAPELARMKPGAILINTARGPLVDETALLAALHEGRIHAGLDVFEPEPLPQDSPWRTAPNTVLTPHLGYGTNDVFHQFYTEAIECVLAFLDGTPIRKANDVP